MAKHSKIGRNDECLCGSGRKYKHCCLGKVAWEALQDAPASVAVRHLSIRGRNLTFFGKLCEALQLDSLAPPFDYAKFKRAFTPRAVKSIYEAISFLWPDYEDYRQCLERERAEVTSLYTGNYEPKAVFSAVTRHSIYSQKIYLPDPFEYPSSMRDEFNPILHPAEYRANAIKWAALWFTLSDWIGAGIVNFIRIPGDFLPEVRLETLQIQKEKFEQEEELRELVEQQAEEFVKSDSPMSGGMTEHFLLSHSDDALRGIYRSFSDQNPWKSEDKFLEFIRYRRDTHPYYVENVEGQNSQFLHGTTGTNYEMAKRICEISGSHIITDLRSRWKEVELDHKHAGEAMQVWSPFAKALQSAELKVLQHVPLPAALQLRKEERLRNMRYFLQKVWRSCKDPNEFSTANATNLAAELEDQIREAKAEWDKIDQELAKWLGGLGGIAATLVTTGAVDFVPAGAATVVAGTTGLGLAQWQRKSFKCRFPAGFFLGLKS